MSSSHHQSPFSSISTLSNGDKVYCRQVHEMMIDEYMRRRNEASTLNRSPLVALARDSLLTDIQRRLLNYFYPMVAAANTL